jgi:hypothetical protein
MRVPVFIQDDLLEGRWEPSTFQIPGYNAHCFPHPIQALHVHGGQDSAVLMMASPVVSQELEEGVTAMVERLVSPRRLYDHAPVHAGEGVIVIVIWVIVVSEVSHVAVNMLAPEEHVYAYCAKEVLSSHLL